MLNLSITTHPAQYSLLLGCCLFSICVKLDASLTACRRNSLYGINPVEMTIAFSSQQNLTSPADSAGIWEPGILAQPGCRALAPVRHSSLCCHMFAVVRSEHASNTVTICFPQLREHCSSSGVTDQLVRSFLLGVKCMNFKNNRSDINCCPSATSFRKANPEGSTTFRKPGKKMRGATSAQSGLQCFILCLPQKKKKEK